MKRVENGFTPFLLKILLLYLLVFIGYTRKDKSSELWLRPFSVPVNAEYDSTKIASSQRVGEDFEETADTESKNLKILLFNK
jgi:hypothetical protein